MTYELFLTVFNRAETAGEATICLREFVQKGDLQVLDVVVLARPADDTAVIRQIGNLGSQHGGRIGAIVGGLLGTVGGPMGVAALGAAGAAFGAASEFLASRDLEHDDLQEMQQALVPGASALLALLAPEHAEIYVRRIADFGGDTMRFGLTNDAGQEYQDAKHAFIARQVERRREQSAAWSSITADEIAELAAMNHDLEQRYAAMGSTPDGQQTGIGEQAAAMRTRRDAARGLLNQTLAAEVERLDEVIASYQEAISRALSDDERAALTAQLAALRSERQTAQQQLAASQEAELRERWRDISALEAIATRANRATRITLDMQLAELRDMYAAARQGRARATTKAL
jgi:uncharacterized membrane protein